MDTTDRTYTVFCGSRRLCAGPLPGMLRDTKRHLEQGGDPVLIFEDQTGQQVEFDFEGSEAEVLSRVEFEAPCPVEPASQPRPGRPKLGVVSREVSLLPRHWEWLERQPGGLSATLRKLVETESKVGRNKELARNAREAASKFMWAMAGDLPGFEEASRALYAKDQARLLGLIDAWPKDIRAHVIHLVTEAARLDALVARPMA